MFKDWYKKANDDIQPNEELLARILAQNSLKRPARRKLYPLGVAAAGICIVSAAILSYPVLRDLNKERSSDILPPDNAVVVTHQPAETDLPDGTPVVTAAPVQAAESTILPKKQAENTKTAEKTSKPKKTIVPQKTQTPTVKPKAPGKNADAYTDRSARSAFTTGKGRPGAAGRTKYKRTGGKGRDFRSGGLGQQGMDKS